MREYGIERLAERGERRRGAARARPLLRRARLAQSDAAAARPGQLEALQACSTPSATTSLGRAALPRRHRRRGARAASRSHLGWYWLLPASTAEAATWLRLRAGRARAPADPGARRWPAWSCWSTSRHGGHPPGAERHDAGQAARRCRRARAARRPGLRACRGRGPARRCSRSSPAQRRGAPSDALAGSPATRTRGCGRRC